MASVNIMYVGVVLRAADKNTGPTVQVRVREEKILSATRLTPARARALSWHRIADAYRFAVAQAM